MYLEDYKRWCESKLEDEALVIELESISGNEEEILHRNSKDTWRKKNGYSNAY